LKKEIWVFPKNNQFRFKDGPICPINMKLGIHMRIKIQTLIDMKFGILIRIEKLKKPIRSSHLFDTRNPFIIKTFPSNQNIFRLNTMSCLLQKKYSQPMHCNVLRRTFKCT